MTSGRGEDRQHPLGQSQILDHIRLSGHGPKAGLGWVGPHWAGVGKPQSYTGANLAKSLTKRGISLISLKYQDLSTVDRSGQRQLGHPSAIDGEDLPQPTGPADTSRVPPRRAASRRKVSIRCSAHPPPEFRVRGGRCNPEALRLCRGPASVPHSPPAAALPGPARAG